MSDLVATTWRGDAAIIDRIASAWRSFVADTPNGWAMHTPDWLRTWYGVFGNGRPLVIVTVSDGDALVAVAPFLETGIGPARIWRCPANLSSGRADIAVHPVDRDRILDVLWQEIYRHPWVAIDWRFAPDDGNLAALISRRRAQSQPVYSRQTHRTPVALLGPEVDPDRLGPAKHMRRARRQLAALGTLTELRTCPATHANLDTFFRLEAAGWKGRIGTDAGKDPQSAAFYRALIDQADHGDFVAVCHEIKLDDTTIAIDIGVRAGRRHFALKGSYDEGWRTYSPGQLSIAFMLRESQAAGFTSYDFLGTDEPYKLRWTDTIEPLSHHIVFRQSPLGRGLDFAMGHGVPAVKRLRAIRRRRLPSRLVTAMRLRCHRRRTSID